MGKKDKRVDTYIANARPFAKPILNHLRQLVHKACPEVTETIKWGMPSFEYKGVFCGMASFKQHAVFGFWKHALLKDPKGYLKERSSQGGDAMGNLGRITSLKDLPPDSVIIDFVLQARKLNDDGTKLPAKPKKPKAELVVPSWFTRALGANKKAKENFEKFSYYNKREYVMWLTEAKTEDTRNARLETAIDWISEGKPRNWKYMKKYA